MSAGDQAIFKQTALGSLPVDWDVVPLNEICWFQEGPGLRKWQFTSRGMKVINVTNLTGEILDLDKTDRHISLSEFNDQYQHFAVDANDIVMASSGNSYGKIALVRECDLPLMMNTSVIRFKPKERTCFSYAWTFLRSDFFKSQIDLMITGGAQPNFGPYHLNKVLVQLPPLSEQMSISDALTDQDKIIGSLDQLIAKKRNIQQATMQQLLTGKRRLPGFSGGWEEASLGEISYISKGEQLSQRGDAAGLIPHFNGGVSASSYTDTANTPEDTIAISEGGNSCGFVQFITTPFWCGGHCYAVRPRGIENLFLYFALKGKQDRIMGLRVGSGLPNIQKSALNSFKIALPSCRYEQTAIATILADMDSELAALEARRDKAHQLRQGMMQELLTGRIRLRHGN